MFRKLLLKASRHVWLRRKLPSDLGGIVLHLSPKAGGLKYWKPNLEAADPELLSLVREYVKPGMCVWDVGANVGLFAFSAAGRAGANGKVLALEPDVDCLQGLLRTQQALALADVAEMTILGVAASRGVHRIARFLIAADARASNSLDGFGNTVMGGVAEVRTVVTLSLDELLDATFRPQVIKIDVEGAEMDVLAGANRVLQEVRPTILLEVSQSQQRAVAELFSRYKYDVLDGSKRPADRVPLREAAWTTVAVPRAQ